MGGMAAFIPTRRDPEVNAPALEKVRADKTARPPTASTAPGWPTPTWCRLQGVVRPRPGRPAEPAGSAARRRRSFPRTTCWPSQRSTGQATEAGLRNNVDVGLRYLEAWLRGNGAVGIHNLMEDAATAEISRSQIWQWMHNDVRLDTGDTVTADLVRRIADEELADIRAELGEEAYADSHFQLARELFERVALADDFTDFLTLPAYEAISARD